MDASKLDVNSMIDAARKAESDALDRLLDAYRTYLGLLARTWIDTSLLRKADPSDLVQETLLKANQHFGKFRGTSEAELVAWLRQVLAHNVIDLVRRFRGAAARQVSRERSLDEMLSESSQLLGNLIAASGTSPSQKAERRDMGVVLAEALTDLSADHREVIVLRSIEELDWDDVASRMGRSTGAVRMLWARALKEIRPAIEARL